MQEAVAGKAESVDLDLGFLALMHKADIAVWHHGLDFEMAVLWNHHEQRLRRGHYAADRMDGELLHDAINWRGERLSFSALFGLDHILF